MKHLEGLAATASNSAEKLAELAPRASSERAKFQEEIAELKQQLAQTKVESSGDSSLRALQDEIHQLEEDRETVSCPGLSALNESLT